MSPDLPSQQVNLEEFLTLCSPAERPLFQVLANYAGSLGYKPKKDAARSLSFSFRHPRVKQTLLRFVTSRENAILKLKFYAARQYSEPFQEAIRRTIEEYDFRYTGCYGCGKCEGSEGYIYRYPDGREFFRCGLELIEFFEPSSLPVQETLDLFRQQHEYFLQRSGQPKS